MWCAPPSAYGSQSGVESLMSTLTVPLNGSPVTSSSPAAEWWCYEPSPVEGWRPLKSVLPGGGTDSLPA